MKIELVAKVEDENNKLMGMATPSDLLFFGRIREDPDMINRALKLSERLPEMSPEDMLTDYLQGLQMDQQLNRLNLKIFDCSYFVVLYKVARICHGKMRQYRPTLRPTTKTKLRKLPKNRQSVNDLSLMKWPRS